MTAGDRKGQIFLNHPHTNNGSFSSSQLNTSFFILKKLPEVPEYAADEVTIT